MHEETERVNYELGRKMNKIFFVTKTFRRGCVSLDEIILWWVRK